MADDDEPFLKRWSRKKRLDAEDPAGRGPTAEADSAAASMRSAVEDEPAREPLDLDALPKLDDLTPASDIKAFLDPRVPVALRDAALKRIWTLDPTIRDFIEVAENQWDWNTPGGAPGYEPLEDAKLVARLLDHAVGAMMGPREDDPHILSSHVSSLSPPQSGDVAAHKAPSAPFDGEGASKTVAMGTSADIPQPDAVPHNTNDGDNPPASLRRRHGSALPG